MTKIKICGLSRFADIDAVNRWRPDYVGFVFAASKRRVTMQEAAELSRRLDPAICPVGVFVNTGADEIIAAVAAGIIRAVQLHGQESPEQVMALRRQLPKTVPVMKAVGMEAGREQELAGWQQSSAEYLLLDAPKAGSGAVFDHNLIEKGQSLTKPWFLAGGINGDNVIPLIRRFAPYGIDVSSGVETGGCKDPQKIEFIIRRVRNE